MPLVVWPLALTFARLLMGPAMLLFAWLDPHAGPGLAAGVVVGFLTDLFDGILARRLNVATPGLRRFDSQTDLVFWLCVLGSVFVARWEIGVANLGYIVGILVLEAAIYALSFLRFGREACTHAYSAKAWSVLAVGVFVVVLGFGEGAYSFAVLFFTYAVTWLDVVAILLLLPAWRSDVPSCYHAWLIRRGVPFRTWKFFH
ncbi:MAG TPA: CDP-alcohol phosphatidyltransferase family protein [Gemmataceae bacterium]|nr:CDP-alcohol phosphatidyltransferase family protein [Gemmataceae bacterium]